MALLRVWLQIWFILLLFQLDVPSLIKPEFKLGPFAPGLSLDYGLWDREEVLPSFSGLYFHNTDNNKEIIIYINKP